MPKNSGSIPQEVTIRTRAYQLWEAEGKPDSRDLDHWLRAKTELTAGTRKFAAKDAPAKSFLARKA